MNNQKFSEKEVPSPSTKPEIPADNPKRTTEEPQVNPSPEIPRETPSTPEREIPDERPVSPEIPVETPGITPGPIEIPEVM